MANKDYAGMTLDELLKKNQSFMEKVGDIKDEQREIAKAIDLKIAEQKLANLSEKETDSLRQVLKV